jgi:hypothetical protein
VLSLVKHLGENTLCEILSGKVFKLRIGRLERALSEYR